MEDWFSLLEGKEEGREDEDLAGHYRDFISSHIHDPPLCIQALRHLLSLHPSPSSLWSTLSWEILPLLIQHLLQDDTQHDIEAVCIMMERSNPSEFLLLLQEQLQEVRSEVGLKLLLSSMGRTAILASNSNTRRGRHAIQTVVDCTVEYVRGLEGEEEEEEEEEKVKHTIPLETAFLSMSCLYEPLLESIGHSITSHSSVDDTTWNKRAQIVSGLLTLVEIVATNTTLHAAVREENLSRLVHLLYCTGISLYELLLVTIKEEDSRSTAVRKWSTIGIGVVTYLALMRRWEDNWMPSILDSNFKLALLLPSIACLLQNTVKVSLDPTSQTSPGVELLQASISSIKEGSFRFDSYIPASNSIVVDCSSLITQSLIMLCLSHPNEVERGAVSKLILSFLSIQNHRMRFEQTSKIISSCPYSNAVSMFIDASRRHVVQYWPQSASHAKEHPDNEFVSSKVHHLVISVFDRYSDLKDGHIAIVSALNLYYLLLKKEREGGPSRYCHTVGAWDTWTDMKETFILPMKEIAETQLRVERDEEVKRQLDLVLFSIATVIDHMVGH